MSLDEAASLLDANPAAVKQRVLEARRELSVALDRRSQREHR
jgi:DNA-directed RNA polymerase specialized sigma24 family protein